MLGILFWIPPKQDPDTSPRGQTGYLGADPRKKSGWESEIRKQGRANKRLIVYSLRL